MAAISAPETNAARKDWLKYRRKQAFVASPARLRAGGQNVFTDPAVSGRYTRFLESDIAVGTSGSLLALM